MSCQRDWKNPYDPDVSQIYWAPKNLQIEIISKTEVKLTWDISSDYGSAFIIERRINEGYYAEIDTTYETFYIDSSISIENIYTYRIRAFDEKKSQLLAK